MKIRKAVITAASPGQHTLPLQRLVDRQGIERTALELVLEEVSEAGVDEICVIIQPGDEKEYVRAAGEHAGTVQFIEQPQPLGYGDAVYRAKAFVGDASFLHLLPMMSVITNVEPDHMEHYEGDVKNYHQAFIDFVQNLPFYGVAVACLDDAGVRELIPQLTRQVITYGASAAADFRLNTLSFAEGVSSFSVSRPGTDDDLLIDLPMPGAHNALNALAAIAVCSELGVTDSHIKQGLGSFAGVGRRFSLLGQLSWAGGQATLLDDYGHHPTELRATILAARQAYPTNRLVMVFQPHRFTRTRDCYDDFVDVLSEVDALVLLDVYSAGEDEIPSADSRSLARSIRQSSDLDPVHLSNPALLAERLQHILQDGDLLLMQGAGNIGRLSKQLASSNSLEALL